MRVAFGPGWVARRFRIGDIHAARVVRNPWDVGRGIKRMPQGWVFSVAGLDAVELEMRDQRKFRIGTDAARQLAMAIESARRRRGPSK